MNKTAQQFGKNPLPLSDKLIQECLRYHWPGNLRELGNFVKRFLVLDNESALIEELEYKTKVVSIEEGGSRSSAQGGLKALVRGLKDDAEAKEIQRALESTNWNRKLAAAHLNISYKALLYKIKQHGIAPRADRDFKLCPASGD